MKIAYLIHNIYGIGGTNRTVINQASALRHRHDVEIVSVFRHRDHPVLPIPPGVTVTSLVDTRLPPGEGVGVQGRRLHEGEERAGLPPEVFPREETRQRQYSLLTDDRLRDYLAGTDADVVVGTRPGLIVSLVRLAPDRIVKVGQEHLTHDMHPERLMAVMSDVYRGLDALVTVTEADARQYRERMDLPGVRVLAIPNSVPAPAIRRACGTDPKTVVAAGRIEPIKRFDLLIDAFSRVAPKHPDWTLRIYGDGSELPALRRQVERLGLSDAVLLMGPHPRIEEAWALGSFAAVTSARESFGMTIVEAMRAGLPVLSTACPLGPPEIIRDGVDGLLVANGDVAAVADGLDRMMGDDAARTRMARNALHGSARFDPETIARRHEELFHELAGRPLPPASPPPPASATAVECTAAASATGSATLRFARPPHRVLLRAGSAETALAVEEDGTVTVDPEDPRLSPGAWSVHRVDGDSVSPVPASLIDLRAYPLDPASVKRLSLAVPTRDAANRLGVVIRRAEPHAEVEAVAGDGSRLTLTGTLLGDSDLPDARLRLVRRGPAPAERLLPCPVGPDGAFTASIPVADLLLAERSAPEETWDLELVPHADSPGVRIGRHLDGVLGHGRTVSYPAAEVEGTDHGDVHVRPVFDAEEALTVEVRDTGTDARAAAAAGPVEATARLESFAWEGSRLRLRLGVGLAPEGAAAPVLGRAGEAWHWLGPDGSPAGPDMRWLRPHNRIEVELRNRRRPHRRAAFHTEVRTVGEPDRTGGSGTPRFEVTAVVDLAAADGGRLTKGQWDVVVRVRYFGVEAETAVRGHTAEAEEQRRPACYAAATFADVFWSPDGALTVSVDGGLSFLHRALRSPADCRILDRPDHAELVIPLALALTGEVPLHLEALRQDGDTSLLPAVLGEEDGRTVLRARMAREDVSRPGLVRLRAVHGTRKGSLGLVLRTGPAERRAFLRSPLGRVRLTDVALLDGSLRITGEHPNGALLSDGLRMAVVLVERESGRELRFPVSSLDAASFTAEVPLSGPAPGTGPDNGVFDLFAVFTASGLDTRVRVGADRSPSVAAEPLLRLVPYGAGRRLAVAYFTRPHGNLSLEVGAVRNAPVSAVRVESASWRTGDTLRVTAVPTVGGDLPRAAVLRATAEGAAPLEAPARVEEADGTVRITAELSLGVPGPRTAELVWDLSLVLVHADGTRYGTALRPDPQIPHSRTIRGLRAFTFRPVTGRAGARLAVRVRPVPLLRSALRRVLR